MLRPVPAPFVSAQRSRHAERPLIYACSGYSSAAQMANHIALEIDQKGLAEMSCIAGVGGGVPQLVSVARSGRPIVALDGCPLACTRACLARVGVRPLVHHVLSEFGVKKMRGRFDPGEAARALRRIEEGLSFCSSTLETRSGK